MRAAEVADKRTVVAGNAALTVGGEPKAVSRSGGGGRPVRLRAEVIDAKVAALTTAAQKLGEKMYADMQAKAGAASAGAEAGAAGAGAGAGASEARPKEDDVVDADFKEVKKG